MIDHDVSINRLGLTDRVLTWFKIYIKKFYISLGDHTSEKRGAFQGALVSLGVISDITKVMKT